MAGRSGGGGVGFVVVVATQLQAPVINSITPALLTVTMVGSDETNVVAPVTSTALCPPEYCAMMNICSDELRPNRLRD